MATRIRTWLQLFRAPNLFTVGGDPLAGFLLANFGIATLEVFAAGAASLCFYAAGMLHNDLADLAEDRAERPGRPLPSGAARPGTVATVAGALAVVGLLLCLGIGVRTFLTGLGLLAAIGSYNQGMKRVAGLGSLNMGLCRSLSLVLGASAAPAGMIPGEVWVAAAVIGIFIAAVTNLARFETSASCPAYAKWVAPVVLMAAVAVTLNWPPMGTGGAAVVGGRLMTALLGLAAALSAGIAWRLSKRPAPPIPPAIGQNIRLLLPVQAAFCAHTGLFGILAAALLLALWPVSRAVSKRFYAS